MRKKKDIEEVNGIKLDNYQKDIILDDSQNLLVVAGAGSGKTLTIIGKIEYLIEVKGIKPKEILCISFTNETVNNLIEKSGYDINCFTFHKLALEIIKSYKLDYNIAPDDLLEYLCNEYFSTLIYIYGYQKYVSEYLKKEFKAKYNYDEIRLLYPEVLDNYINSIISFIKKIKSNNHNINDFHHYLSKTRFSDKNKNFLIIVFHIYKLYLEELNSTYSLDFDDMITLATEYVHKWGIKAKYKYIIIDEYQDTSLVRFKLIKAIIESTNAKLMCVGDDYQSIYGFSGTTLDLFVNFYKYFDESKILKIINNYRNPYQLLKISSSFINKNRYQIKKYLRGSKILAYPIKIIYYSNSSYKYKFRLLLEYLYQHDMKNILILGRYNKDIYELMDKVEYKDMNIRYLTIHKAKGLEEDNVILINMTNKINGFPSKMEENKITKKIFKSKEKYPYSEERRLFYVALTRSRNNVFIMSNKNYESIFVTEIKGKTIELKL